MLKRFKQWIVRKTFERFYKYYLYPFEKADTVLDELPERAKYLYLDDIRHWVDSKAYKVEMEELVRTFYQELSIKPLSTENLIGYRLCLIFLKNLEARFHHLKQLAEVEEQQYKIQNKL